MLIYNTACSANRTGCVILLRFIINEVGFIFSNALCNLGLVNFI